MVLCKLKTTIWLCFLLSRMDNKRKCHLSDCSENLSSDIHFIQYCKFTIQGCIVQRRWGPLGQLLMITCPVLLTVLVVLFQMPHRLCPFATCDYMWTCAWHWRNCDWWVKYRRWRHRWQDRKTSLANHAALCMKNAFWSLPEWR